MHTHSVHDADSHFRIDTISRKIINESSAKTHLMQYDHNSERFTFEIPKEIEGHNVMDCNVVEIHYLNTNSTSGESYEGVYDVDDMQLDGDIVRFSWLISANATAFVGSLNFIIRFSCVGDDGTVDYAWHTDIYEKIKVAKSINNTDAVYTQYADVLEQWKLNVLTIAKGTNGFSPVVEFVEVADGVEISITDEQGTKTATLKHGHTPQKGIDYFDGVNGKDGHTPIKGVDYFDGVDGHTPVKGVDYFDGENGIGIKSIKQTTTTTEESGVNVITITLEDGTTSTVTLRNGYKGADGKDGVDGKTPKKGVDYWTNTDVADMKAYIDAQLGVIENGTY